MDKDTIDTLLHVLQLGSWGLAIVTYGFLLYDAWR